MTSEQQDWLAGLANVAIAEVPRYLPNLTCDPAGCVQYYVTQPTPDSELVDIVFAASPGSLYVQFKGGLDPHDIVGIFPLNEPDEALCLGESLLDDLDTEIDSHIQDALPDGQD